LEEYKRAYREIRKEEEKRGFLIHLTVYLFVNAMPKKIWFFYPLFGWGIGVTMHYLFGVRWLDKILEEREAKAERRAREKR